MILSGVDGRIFWSDMEKKPLRNKDGNVGVAQRRLPLRGTFNVTQYLDICVEKNESEMVYREIHINLISNFCLYDENSQDFWNKPL